MLDSFGMLKKRRKIKIAKVNQIATIHVQLISFMELTITFT